MRKGSRRRRFFVLGLIVVVLAGGGFFWFQTNQGGDSVALAADGKSTGGDDAEGDAEKDENPAVPVELEPAATRNIPSYFSTTGTLEALRQVELISKAQGQIMRLAVEEGDFVKRGAVLLEFDHREQKILKDQAQVRSETTRLELERMQNMSDRGLATDRELETARQAYDVNKLEYELAKVRLENHIVRAPFAGQVTARMVELGQTVSVGAPLVNMADISPLEVRLFLPEKIVSQLKLGQPVDIRPDVQPEPALEGVVHRIAPVVDPGTATMKVTLRVEDPRGEGRVGSFVRARITTDVHENAIAVPKRSVVNEAGASFVFVAEADSVRKVAVELGYVDDDHVELLDGIDAGEVVVTVGQGGLRTGSRIRDLSQPEAAADSTGGADSDEETQVAAAASKE